MCTMRFAPDEEADDDWCEQLIAYVAGFGAGWVVERCLNSEGPCGILVFVCAGMMCLSALLSCVLPCALSCVMSCLTVRRRSPRLFTSRYPAHLGVGRVSSLGSAGRAHAF